METYCGGIALKYLIDGNGVYLGAYDDSAAPAGYIEVDNPPDDAKQIYINGAWVLPLSLCEEKIAFLYKDAMHTLQNGYSQEEINTFPVKGEAAKAYIAGNADDEQKYLLAKIVEVVNGSSPLTLAQISAEVATIDAAGWAKVQAKAESIMNNKLTFEFYLSKIEQRCSHAKGLLVDDEDNTGVINALTAELQAVKASIKGA